MFLADFWKKFSFAQACHWDFRRWRHDDASEWGFLDFAGVMWRQRGSFAGVIEKILNIHQKILSLNILGYGSIFWRRSFFVRITAPAVTEAMFPNGGGRKRQEGRPRLNCMVPFAQNFCFLPIGNITTWSLTEEHICFCYKLLVVAEVAYVHIFYKKIVF